MLPRPANNVAQYDVAARGAFAQEPGNGGDRRRKLGGGEPGRRQRLRQHPKRLGGRRAGYVSQYDVGPGGELSPKSPAKVAAGEGAGSVTVSPDGGSVYVINRWEGSAPIRRGR